MYLILGFVRIGILDSWLSVFEFGAMVILSGGFIMYVFIDSVCEASANVDRLQCRMIFKESNRRRLNDVIWIDCWWDDERVACLASWSRFDPGHWWSSFLNTSIMIAGQYWSFAVWVFVLHDSPFDRYRFGNWILGDQVVSSSAGVRGLWMDNGESSETTRLSPLPLLVSGVWV